jgi:Uma2 family endonuclease
LAAFYGPNGAIYETLLTLTNDEDTGQFYGRGMRFTNVQVGLSTQPDAIIVSHERHAQKMVQHVAIMEGDYDELVGSPDMVLEVLSRTTQKRDSMDYPQLYFESGILEYWLIEARCEPLKFDIFRRGREAFDSSPVDADGFVQSVVFNRSFRLVRKTGRWGPDFSLESR